MPPLCLASASLSALLPVAVRLAVEELDALPLNLGDVAVLPLLILIFAGGELALDEHEAPLGEVLRTGFGLPVPKDDLVPFRLVDLLAPVVGVALIRSHVQAAYGLSGLGVAHLGIAPEPSDDHHLVEAAHTISC